jgi:hypothetical protein
MGGRAGLAWLMRGGIAAAGTNHQRMTWSDGSRAIGAYAQGRFCS